MYMYCYYLIIKKKTNKPGVLTISNYYVFVNGVQIALQNLICCYGFFFFVVLCLEEKKKKLSCNLEFLLILYFFSCFVFNNVFTSIKIYGICNQEALLQQQDEAYQESGMLSAFNYAHICNL